MPITVLMPALSPTMECGNLVKWLKKEGDKVSSGDIIAEVETDKATMEIECFDDGTIGKILVAEGAKKVLVNTKIAIILLENETLESIIDQESISSLNNQTKLNNQDKSQKLLEANNMPLSTVVESTDGSRIKASPLAKRVANELKVDIAKIVGSGPYGRIVKDDVLNFANASTIKTVGLSSMDNQIVEISPMRAIIAERLLLSKQTIPHYYLSIDCNIDALLSLRHEMNNEFGYKITLNDLIIKAVGLALKKHPAVNSSWCETHIVQYASCDVAVAVAIKGGLITPIIKNVDQKTLSKVSEDIKLMAEKAKSGTLNKEEYQGGSITVSNLGMYDIKEFIAIINPPNSSILAVGKGEKRPIVVQDEIKIATIMNATLSLDHRVIDGATGAEFMKTLKIYLEKPMLMMA